MRPVLLSDTVHTDSFTAYNNNSINNNVCNGNTTAFYLLAMLKQPFFQHT